MSALKGSAVPASGYIPEGLIGYSPSLGYKQDIAKAKALLKQAGYGSGGKKLSLVLTLANGDADESLTASIMKSDLAAVGVDLTVQQLEWQTQWAKGKSTDASKRQDIFLFYWYPDYADPYSWFINLFHSASPPFFNLSYLASKPIDSSIDTLQAKTATNHAKANADYVALAEVAARPGRRRPAVRAELRADLPEVDDRLRRQPRLLQRRVHLQPASRVT